MHATAPAASINPAAQAVVVARVTTRQARHRPAMRSILRSLDSGTLLALGFLVLVHVVMVFGPLAVRTSPEEINPASVFAPPSGEHLLGTDEAGRDVLSRLLHGGRVTLSVALAAMLISVTAGTLIGGISGYFGGAIGGVLMRITDGMMALPTFFLLLVVTALYRSGQTTLIVVIGLTAWMGVARVIRSEFLRWRSREFIEAARCVGASHWRIMLKHLLPQAVPSMSVAASIGVSVAILTESGLSYLGLGIPPPDASWGNLLLNAQTYLYRDPFLAVYPGVMILLVVLAYNFLGDGLREALDPETSRE
jgi:peptide/nickel transport system permease protein